MTAAVQAPITRRSDPEAFEIVLRDRVDDDWMATLGGGRSGPAADITRARILDRIESPTIFARVVLDGRPAAVGLGVVEADLVGIYCVATVPGLRRRGAATAVMSALLVAAAERGAGAVYLAVSEENLAARSLYDRLGFRTSYRYHYRWLPPGR